MISYFDYTSHGQATYVIIRHVPVEHRNKLQEVLQHHCKLPIVEASNNMMIENDKVYMPLASMYMFIQNDRLYLKERLSYGHITNWSLDIFLHSLAESKKNRSIAIILSGRGSDGSKGAISVKGAGGMVIAQELDSCEYKEMPGNVIKNGPVDHILLPSQMPKVVLQHISSIPYS